ncbi:MAG: hypothetical protein CBR30_08385 [Dictyoglomus sp. NZ13-RE01]|nr:MAG: hypothetical protein CBR30_08385 [Dictyoglomus sp. NZ13-RE01]
MKDKGQLVIVISIILFLFILGGIILSLIPSENLMVRKQIESNQAFYLAQAGLQNAVYLVNSNKNLLSLNLSSKRFNSGLIISYTITETSGIKITDSYTLPISLGEFYVTASYSMVYLPQSNVLSPIDLIVIKSTGYVPSNTSSATKRSIEIYGRVDNISLDAFRFAVYASRNATIGGNSTVQGEPLPDGTFDVAVYARGDVSIPGHGVINNTSNPIPGRDYIESDSSVQVPILNEAYLRSVSQAQGLYRSGSRIKIQDLIRNVVMSNPNWYNSATNTYNTWSLVIFVDGNAEFEANLDFQGMIIVKGSFSISGTGSNKIAGIVYAQNLNAVDEKLTLTIDGNPTIIGCSLGEDVDISGSSVVKHNSQNINNILSTHGIENVVQKTRGNLKILSWREF